MNCIASEEAASDRIGQQVLDLREELSRSLVKPRPSELDPLESDNLQDGEIYYPVWFCTNRKVQKMDPAKTDGIEEFAEERDEHNAITRGCAPPGEEG